MPTIAVVDFEAPLPAAHTHVHTDDVDLELAATVPLQSYRVSLRARGEAYEDPAGLLRGESGRPVELEMDLVWTTAGTPYQYRPVDALRDPVHGLRHGDRGRSLIRARCRGGPAGPLVGGAGLVEHGLGMECTASRRRHSPTRLGPQNPRRAADGGRLRSARGRPSGVADGPSPGRRSARTICRSGRRWSSRHRTSSRPSTCGAMPRCC